MPEGNVNSPPRFPFSAIVGMDTVKKALLCALVNPHIKCVLIRGDPGVAKTTISRSVSGKISGKSIVNIPLNISEEQLVGGLDIEATLKNGKAIMHPGLMKKTDGNLAYIDDINLMDQKTVSCIMDSVIGGKVLVEREGVSSVYYCNTTLIATMNPEDVDISSHMLDRFDICAYATFPEESNERVEILKRNLEYLDDPRRFMEKFAEDEDELLEKISRSKNILPFVTISDELMAIAIELCEKVGAQGYRGSVAMAETAIAIAALNNRDEVIKKDVEEAAELCLPHRRDYTPPPPQDPPEPPENDDSDDRNDDPRDQQPPEPPENNDNDETPKDDDPNPLPPEDEVFEIGDQFRVRDYLGERPRTPGKTKSRKGKRDLVESDDRTGRYARSRIPGDTITDVAFDATIRAAAPYQKNRHSDNLTIVIEKGDIREKVRERRSGCTIMFVVDASGSLGVRRRMATVKGAILSMLRDSYVKRDRLGMIAFRRDSAELILPPTKSVEYAYNQLAQLPTGGKTPVGAALQKSSEFMSSYSKSHPGESCCVVMITDGRANVPVKEGSDANKEALEIAESIKVPGLRWIIVDASGGFIHFDNAERLAKKLEGTYIRLEDLNADSFANTIRQAIDE